MTSFKPTVTDREEVPSDGANVRHVVLAAFGQTDEADLVDALRKSGDDVISLVAEDGGDVVGHILFSKLQSPKGCLGLAPVSVLPSRQGSGIGGALIRAGLDKAKQEGWQAVFLLGEPVYYERFGFSVQLADKFETIYPKPYVMARDLAPNALGRLDGTLIYAPPFLELEN